jgi:hypothetical protein
MAQWQINSNGLFHLEIKTLYMFLCGVEAKQIMTLAGKGYPACNRPELKFKRA